MFKHVDVIAVALLLLAVILMSEVRNSAVLAYQSARLVSFTTRHFEQLSLQPRMPQLCITRE